MRKLYDINIIYEGKTIVQQDVSKLTLRGLSPLVVSDQAIKKESSDIFKAKEALIYEIEPYKIKKGVEYTVTGKVVNNNKNYSITATGTVFDGDKNGKYTFKLTNIKGTEIADPINYVSFECNYDGAEIIPLTKDAKINWTTYSIDSTYYGQTITLKEGTNNIELPYGYIIGNNTYTSEDGKTTATIILDVDFTYADTSKWIYFKHLAESTFQLYNIAQFDLSNAIIFSELYGAGVMAIKSIDLKGYDFSNVQVLDFVNCRVNDEDVKDIDTSNVRIMDKCFQSNSYVAFSDLLKWKTDKVTSMVSMFERCPRITKLDLSTWNVSNVKSFQHMFYGCGKLEELDLSGWDMAATANVTDMFGKAAAMSGRNPALKKIIVKNCTQYTLDLIRKALKDSNYSWTYNGIAFIII